MAVHDAGRVIFGLTPTFSADATVVRVKTYKELREALQRTPSALRIIIESRALQLLIILSLLVPVAGIVKTAMEKGYDIEIGWQGVQLKLTAPKQPLGKPPQIGEE